MPYDIASDRDLLSAALPDIPQEELPGLLARLESVRAAAWLRVVAPSAPEAPSDKLLTAADAAQRLGISVTALYRRKSWPFRVEVSPGRVRYSERGLERFIRSRTGR